MGLNGPWQCLQERNASVIRAEGESEAAKLISDATRQYGGGLIELRRIEVSRWALARRRWGGEVTIRVHAHLMSASSGWGADKLS